MRHSEPCSGWSSQSSSSSGPRHTFGPPASQPRAPGASSSDVRSIGASSPAGGHIHRGKGAVLLCHAHSERCKPTGRGPLRGFELWAQPVAGWGKRHQDVGKASKSAFPSKGMDNRFCRKAVQKQRFVVEIRTWSGPLREGL